MNAVSKGFYAGLITAIILPAMAIAGDVTPQSDLRVQTTVMEKIGLVQDRNDDTYFLNNYLPDMRLFVNQDFGGTTDYTYTLIDQENFIINCDVRAYFVGENTSRYNSLGFRTYDPGSPATEYPKLIFPSSSSEVEDYGTSISGTRTETDPVLPGDFVNLGHITSGDRLDFFLLTDGYDFHATNSENFDGLQHLKLYHLLGTDFYLGAWEDTYNYRGGVGHFKDVIFALQITVPEPTTWSLLAGFAIISLVISKLNKRKQHS